MKKHVWGWHMSINASDCNLFAIRDYDTIYKFVKQLVKEIDMVAYGEPQIVHFGSGDKAGYTLTQLIETSNICAHFVDETNAAFFDIFSCKMFSVDTVMNLIDEYFNPGLLITEEKERFCYVES